jgi:hypothetical protein
VLGLAGVPAFNVGAGALGACRVVVAGRVDVDVATHDAVLLNEMLNGEIGLATRAEIADNPDFLLHDRLRLRGAPTKGAVTEERLRSPVVARGSSGYFGASDTVMAQ